MQAVVRDFSVSSLPWCWEGIWSRSSATSQTGESIVSLNLHLLPCSLASSRARVAVPVLPPRACHSVSPRGIGGWQQFLIDWVKENILLKLILPVSC